MPAYVRAIHIDWHIADASPEVRKILPEANERLASSDHTWETFREQLRELAVRHLDVVADAFVEDGDRAYWVFRVRPVSVTRGLTLRELGDARVQEMQIRERLAESAGEAIELPYDEAVTVALARDLALAEELEGDADSLDVPLDYANEDEMRAVLERLARAIDEGGGQFVAEAGLDRFLVALAPGRVSIQKLVITVEPELVGRLVRGDHAGVPGAPRTPGERYAHALYWPRPMLDFLQEHATRTDRSLSYLAQLAFKTARDAIASSERSKLESRKRRFDGELRRQTLYFPGDMLDAMEAQATRLDSSVSFVAQCAVALAREAIVALADAG